jgi:hypothetical protein
MGTKSDRREKRLALALERQVYQREQAELVKKEELKLLDERKFAYWKAKDLVADGQFTEADEKIVTEYEAEVAREKNAKVKSLVFASMLVAAGVRF